MLTATKAPLREDGVVKYMSKTFYPQDIFQSETSEEVEEAWDSWERSKFEDSK